MGLSLCVFGMGLCEVDNVPTNAINDVDTMRDEKTLDSLEFPLVVDPKSSDYDHSSYDSGQTLPEIVSNEDVSSESSGDSNGINVEDVQVKNQRL